MDFRASRNDKRLTVSKKIVYLISNFLKNRYIAKKYQPPRIIKTCKGVKRAQFWRHLTLKTANNKTNEKQNVWSDGLADCGYEQVV